MESGLKQASIFLILFLLMVVSCVSLPRVTHDGKLSTEETELVSLWSIDDWAKRVQAAKGFAVPKADHSEDWYNAAICCFSLAMISFVIAYLTHFHSLIVVGFILGAGSLAAMFFGELADRPILLLSAGLLAILVACGIFVHKFSLIATVKKWMEPDKENGG